MHICGHVCIYTLLVLFLWRILIYPPNYTFPSYSVRVSSLLENILQSSGLNEVQCSHSTYDSTDKNNYLLWDCLLRLPGFYTIL